MRIAEVIGKVTLNRSHPSFDHARLRLVVPLNLDDLSENKTSDAAFSNADLIVAYDELGSGINSRVLLSEGPEAAQPFRPEIKPVDAYIAGILDTLHIKLPKELT